VEDLILFHQLHSPIRYIRHEEKRGRGGRRLTGFELLNPII
jgi:hypothetical protein